MQLINKLPKTLLRNLWPALSLGVFAISPTVSAKMPHDYCESATAIELNATLRDSQIGVNGLQCFEAYIESSGIFELDASVSGFAQAEPFINFFGQICRGPRIEMRNFVYVERSAASLLLEIRSPGNYLFCVSAQDPLLRLDDYKLTNAFVSNSNIESGDTNEDEPDPDPVVFGCAEKSGDTDEDEPDPDPVVFGCAEKSGDTNEDEPDPDPVVFGCGEDDENAADREHDIEPWPRRLSGVISEICLAGEVDDHGNSPICATPLEFVRPVHGEIWNEWGDDDDFFMFNLSTLRTVEIETSGESDTVGFLYDRYGHQLTIDNDGGVGDNFRIVKTLAPGWYFVRVEGRHRSEGAYRLSVKLLDRWLSGRP